MNVKKKSFILVILCSLLIYINSPFTPFSSTAFANDGNGSTIAGISVKGMKSKEIQTALEKAVNTYVATPVTISGGGAQIDVDASQLTYDVSATVKEFESLTDKPWYAFWESKKVVHLPLKVSGNDIIQNEISNVSNWETEATYTNFLTIASYLRSHEMEAVVASIINLDNERVAVAIAEVPTAVTTTQYLIDVLNDRVIAPNEEFSYLTDLDPVIGQASRDTVNFGASLVYEAALRANVLIAERHAHLQAPTYLKQGLDAYVSNAEQKDLRFINTHEEAIQLKVSREGINLKVEIYAANELENATVRISNTETVNPRIITRYTQDLAIGRQAVLQEGEPGVRLTVIQINNVTGEEKVVSKDYYAPTNRIVLKSARQPDTTTNTNPDGTPNPDGSSNPDDSNNPDGSTNTGGGNPPIDLDGNGLPDVNEDDDPSNDVEVDSEGNVITGK